MVQKTKEFCTMTQGAMREEYEHHFMKMMRYAPEDTNPDVTPDFPKKTKRYLYVCQDLVSYI
jgi:hypothetical protein